MNERRRDIDWLRIGAVYLLLAFHSARPFDHGWWHVENADKSALVEGFTHSVHQFHMPLLFALAGWSVTGSLERRGTRAYLRERRDRLLVPFVFGCAALIPFARYAEYRHKGEGDAGFLEFLPTFFSGLDRFTWMHLWFLVYLLVFSLLYLPLFQALRRREWRVERVPAWALYAAVVPFALVQVALRGRWPGYQNLYDDWANFSYYSLFFIAGFLLTRFPAIERAVQAEYRRAGAVGLAALTALLALAAGDAEHGALGWVALQSLSALTGVCLVMALFGWAAERLRSADRGLAYLRDSAMPVYVLHQVVIVLLAWPVVDLRIGIAPKLALLFTASSALTVGLHHLVVRRSPLLGRLLGSKSVGARAPVRARLRGYLRSAGGSSPPSSEAASAGSGGGSSS